MVRCWMSLSVLAVDDDESATFAVPSGRILTGPEQLSLPKSFAPKATVQPGEPGHGEPDWLLELKPPLYQVVSAFRAFHSAASSRRLATKFSGSARRASSVIIPEIGR